MLINNIIPFSIVDGPGNRFVIFLQECNLNCLYCHNFETINTCINCGICIPSCSTNSLELVDGKILYHQETCTDCDDCIRACPYDSTPKALDKDAQALAYKILEYKDFIDGVTFSGGECMLQADEILKTVKILKEHDIEVLLDSNGTFDFDSNLELINLVDGFMLDVKAINQDNAKDLTGHIYDWTLNAKKLAQINKLHELRIVDLKDDDTQRVFEFVDNFIKEYPNVKKRINVLAKKPLKQERIERLDAYLEKNHSTL